jgi:hypothetical protein
LRKAKVLPTLPQRAWSAGDRVGRTLSLGKRRPTARTCPPYSAGDEAQRIRAIGRVVWPRCLQLARRGPRGGRGALPCLREGSGTRQYGARGRPALVVDAVTWGPWFAPSLTLPALYLAYASGSLVGPWLYFCLQPSAFCLALHPVSAALQYATYSVWESKVYNHF